MITNTHRTQSVPRCLEMSAKAINLKLFNLALGSIFSVEGREEPKSKEILQKRYISKVFSRTSPLKSIAQVCPNLHFSRHHCLPWSYSYSFYSLQKKFDFFGNSMFKSLHSAHRQLGHACHSNTPLPGTNFYLG